jgi:GTP-binding protein HflX
LGPKHPQAGVYNKCDLISLEALPRKEEAAYISASTGEGLEELKKRIFDVLSKGTKELSLMLPYSKGSLVDLLHKEGRVLSVDYKDSGIELSVVCGPELYARVREYVV